MNQFKFLIGLLVLNLFISFESPAFAEGVSHESELGIVASGGNTDSQTLSAKQATSYAWQENKVSSKGSYLYGESNEIKSANAWSLGVRYDRSLTSRFGLFVGNLWEGDEFAGFDYRNNVDFGGRYDWIEKADKHHLFSELGYRYSYEKKVASSLIDHDTKHSARAYLEGALAVTDAVSAKLWVEYLPNLSEGEDYLLNFEPSMSVSLTKVFAMKLAYLGKYAGKPALVGGKNFDWLYTTALVAKF